MRRLVVYVVILILAIVAGLFLSQDPGYVMLAYGKWSMETSIWFLLIAIVIIVAILIFIFRFVFGVLRTPYHVRRWHSQKRSHRAHSLTSDGVLAMYEGDWPAAEAMLTKGVKSSAVPVVNYLCAAQVAQEQLAYDRRDRYLDEALKADKKERLAVDIMRAQLQLSHHQYDEAMLTLKALKKEAPKHPAVLKLIYRYHLSRKNWRRFLDVVPTIRKQRLIDAEDVDRHVYRAVKKLLQDEKLRLEEVESLWNELPKNLRVRRRILIVYLERLLDFGEHERVSKMIAAELKSKWDDELVAIFARLRMGDASRQLDMVDGWLKKQNASAVLYRTVATTAIHAQAWAIAKTYAEKSLRLEKTSAAYLILALAAERLGEDALMQSALRQGLVLASGNELGL